MREIRATLKLRNNRLITLREQLGYKSARKFALAFDLQYQSYVELENLGYNNRRPRAKVALENGEWGEFAIKIAKIHGVEPSWIWPDSVLAIKESKITKEVSADELALFSSYRTIELPDEILEDAQRAGILEKALSKLPKRSRDILERRAGMSGDCETLEEIGDRWEISRERARQIENRAERQMRRELERMGVTDADEA